MRFLLNVIIVSMMYMIISYFCSYNLASAQTSSNNLVFSNSTILHLEGTLKSENISFVSNLYNAGGGEVDIRINSKQFIVSYLIDQNKLLQVKQIRVVASEPNSQQKSQFDDHLLRLLNAALAITPNQQEGLSPFSLVQQTLGLLIDMLPIGEKIDIRNTLSQVETTAPLANNKTLSAGLGSYASICQERSLSESGKFDDENGQSYATAAVVGDPTTLCVGRCGPRCSGLSRHQRVYTQECLNHDLCTKQFGTWLGNCKNEWFTAVGGYLNGPSCSYFVAGTWQLSYTWGNSEANQTSWSLYKNRALTAGDDNQGSWTINSNNIVIQYSSGCKPLYSGVIADDNISISGTMTCTDGSGSGTFQATYLTTNLDASLASTPGRVHSSGRPGS